jgi:hypothetical protein
VLALYLIDVASVSKKILNNCHYYRTVSCIMQLFRECLQETFTSLFSAEVSTASKGPQSIPLVVNDFMDVYLPLKCNLLD